MITYPDQYLLITDNQSGEDKIYPLSARVKLDLKLRIKVALKEEYCGEIALDGDLIPAGHGGDYYAAIITDGRSPEDSIVWESAEFFTKLTY